MQTTRMTLARPMALALIAALTLGGCGEPEQTQRHGHLVIVGGGLLDNNAEIYDRMLTLTDADGAWGVLPTASAAPVESGRRAVRQFQRYGGEGIAELVDIRQGDHDKAADPEYVSRIEAMRGLFFTGGSQTRIVDVFRPEAGDTPAYQSMRRLLSDGAVVAGTSAGAAMMSNPMIRSGDSHVALTRGRAYGMTAAPEDGVSIGRGMGFFPYGMTDQHFLSRGRLGRLLVAVEETPFQRGYGIDDNRAIHVNLGTGRIEALGGPRALLVLDASHSHFGKDDRQNYRLSLLGSGDAIDGLTGRVTPARGKVPLPRHHGTLQDIATEDDAWAHHVIPDLIEDIALNPARHAIALDESFEIHLIEDQATQYWIDPDGEPESLSVINLRMDIVPR